jgi:hypothetical protein
MLPRQIVSHRIASQVITVYHIASHRIPSHSGTSHRILTQRRHSLKSHNATPTASNHVTSNHITACHSTCHQSKSHPNTCLIIVKTAQHHIPSVSITHDRYTTFHFIWLDIALFTVRLSTSHHIISHRHITFHPHHGTSHIIWTLTLR